VDRAAVPPQPGVLLALATGAAVPRVVAVGEGIAVRTTVTLSASADPGLTDPATAAGLLARVAAALSG
jgi:pyruvate/2-oxoglutarate dehydrogenase complex dihydrolipoamide acyltransferase (E2) component